MMMERLLIDIFGVIIELGIIYYLGYLVLGKSRYRWPTVIFMLLLTFVLFVLFSTYISNKYIRMVLYFVTTFMPLCLFYGRFLLKLYVSLTLLNLSACTEMVVKAVYVGLEGGLVQYNGLADYYYFSGVIVSKMLALLLVHLMLSFRKPPRYPLPTSSLLALLILPITTIFAGNQFMSFIYQIDEAELYFRMAVLLLLLVFSNIILFYLFEKQMESYQYKTEIAMAQRQLQEQADFYHRLIREKQEINKMSHDLKNRLLALTGYLRNQQTEEALQYLNTMKIQLEDTYTHVTGFVVIDTVLAEKKNRALEQNTRLQIKTSMQGELKINDMDLALLLANGLDNAIEATAKIEEAVITLSISVEPGYVDIIMDNPIQHQVIIQQNRIKTTKADPLHHGLGMRTIEELIQKYQGNMKLYSENNNFTLDIMLLNQSM